MARTTPPPAKAVELIARYRARDPRTQHLIATQIEQDLRAHGNAVQVTQGKVSDHLQGKSWNWDLPGAYMRVLGIPADEMLEAFGWTESRRRPARKSAAG